MKHTKQETRLRDCGHSYAYCLLYPVGILYREGAGLSSYNEHAPPDLGRRNQRQF